MNLTSTINVLQPKMVECLDLSVDRIELVTERLIPQKLPEKLNSRIGRLVILHQKLDD